MGWTPCSLLRAFVFVLTSDCAMLNVGDGRGIDMEHRRRQLGRHEQMEYGLFPEQRQRRTHVRRQDYELRGRDGDHSDSMNIVLDSFTLDRGWLLGSGNIQVNNSSSVSGTIVADPGGLTFSARWSDFSWIVDVWRKHWYCAGTMIWNVGTVQLNTPGTVFTNTGTSDPRRSSNLFDVSLASATLVNAASGTLKRTIGTSFASIGCRWRIAASWMWTPVRCGLTKVGSPPACSMWLPVSVEFSGGNFLIQAGSSATGRGAIRVTGGTVTATGGTAANKLQVAGGNLRSTGPLTGRRAET